MKSSIRHRSPRGLSLVQTVVCVAIIAVLATLVLSMTRRALERTKCVVCISKLRQIGAALNSRAIDGNGRYYTAAEIGNSSFRQYDDKYSLCQVLKEYITGQEAWISPGAPKKNAQKYGNTYAWSRSTNVTGKRLDQYEVGSTILAWNAYTFTTPSVRNITEGSSGGPKSAPAQYFYYPWKNGKAVNWLYGDCHVETR